MIDCGRFLPIGNTLTLDFAPQTEHPEDVQECTHFEQNKHPQFDMYMLTDSLVPASLEKIPLAQALHETQNKLFSCLNRHLVKYYFNFFENLKTYEISSGLKYFATSHHLLTSI